MPMILKERLHLQEKAAQFRKLSTEHAKAGSSPIAEKLAEVAAELEAEAIALGPSAAERLPMIL
jgi:hypothetical protein